MPKFHIIYKETDKQLSSGMTVEAADAGEAYNNFINNAPDSEFVAMYNIEMASALLHHQLEQADKFPTPELFINSSSQAVEQEGTKENE